MVTNFRLLGISAGAVLMLLLVVIVSVNFESLVATAQVGSFGSGFNKVDDARSQAGIAEGDFIMIVSNIVSGLLLLVAVVALAVLVWGGFAYITSLGDETKTASAKKIILYAIVGLIVIGLAALVVNVAVELIGAGNNNAIINE